MRTRATGEGSLRERKPGQWEGRYRDKKGAAKSVYGKTQTEAAKKLRDALAGREQGVKATPARLTVAAHLDGWLEHHGPELRPSTLRRYESLIRVWIKPNIGTVKLSSLTNETLELRLLRPMAEAGLSYSSIDHVRKVLRSSFQRSQAARVAVQDTKVPKSAAKAKVTPALGQVDVDRIIAALAGTSLQPIVITAAYLGLRNAEVRALQWRDLDMAEGWVHISAQLDTSRRRMPLKTEAGKRDIPLPPNVREALERIRKEQLAVGELTDWVFPSHAGTPLDGVNLLHRFQAALMRKGLPSLPFHALRKARGVMLLEKGQDIRVVSDILGHSDPSFTRRVYQGTTAALKRKAMEA